MKVNLKYQFLIPTAILLLLGMGLSSLLSFSMSNSALVDQAMKSATDQTESAKRVIDNWLMDRKNQLHDLAQLEVYQISTQDTPEGQEARIKANSDLEALILNYPYYSRLNIFNDNGDVVAASAFDKVKGINVTDRNYFKQAMQGKVFISSTMKSKENELPIFVIAAPLEFEGRISGVIMAVVDMTIFSNDYIIPIKVGETGYGYLLNDMGIIIAHPDPSLVLTLDVSEYDWGKTMIAGDTDAFQYEFRGVEKISVSRKLENADWVLGITVPMEDFYSASRSIGYYSLIITTTTLVVMVLFIAWLSNRLIVKPIKRITGVMGKVAKGDLRERVDLKASNEMGVLAKAIDEQIDSLNQTLGMLEKLADGNLTSEIVFQDKDDQIGPVLAHMLDSLNNLMNTANEASNQVSAGSDEVASSSQSLSQGAAEQASTLEEISSSMSEIGSQTRSTAENASQANQLASDSKISAETGSSKMRQMMEAMSEIDESSQAIARIIKVIDEIAFQTNLLALNAAVEAARAGKHGKGFAVVAEEVRNLAGRSAKAAQETEELIEGATDRVKRGALIAEETAEALQGIVQGAAKTADIVAEIAASANEQAQGVSQINEGLAQVDKVTQQNTASAEETAAAAQELSSQATMLTKALSRFKLRGTKRAQTPTIEPSRGEARNAPVSRKATAPAENWGGGDSANHTVSPEQVIPLDDDEFGRY